MAGVTERVPDTFCEFASNRDDARFSEWLRRRAEPHWTAAVEHRFVGELAAGSIDPAAFRRYLVQDYAFVVELVRLVGHAVGQAPSMTAARRLSAFLGVLTDEENDYFERAFDALEVPQDHRNDPPRADVTDAFADLLGRAAHEGDYEETIAVLLAVEWIYLAWATSVAEATPGAFYLREWIDLHANEEFAAFVNRLRDELDDRGPALDARRQRRLERGFRRAVSLEVDFFDAAYEPT